ncbi:Homeobox even-skipped protein 1 [Manacus vitellinus]|uniref:Homeobox even-skipped protein 1 n=1 Tax=Manacus vitellinus TaxID=328815 RepID=A0A093PML8_9PASS|nr:Homeobox even-skipped protein 1 [Manacus vitellinus]
METRKEMVMFLEGTTLGALVGKRVPNLSEAVGSPAPEPQEKMIHRNCLSPRPGPLSSRERGGGGGGGGGGEDEEEVEVLPGTGTVPESRSAAAALLSAGQQPPAPRILSTPGQAQKSLMGRTGWGEGSSLGRRAASIPPCLPSSERVSLLRAPHAGPCSEALAGSPSGGDPKGSGGSGGSQGSLACSASDQMRRYRTAFTREQIARLEKEFYRENYVSRPRRCELAAALNLPETTIKVHAARTSAGRSGATAGDGSRLPPPPYTYMMSHAAATGNLPYPFPSHLPLPYYSHMGIGATSASAATPFSTPLRPLDTFRVLSHPYPRPELLCAFRHPSLYPAPTHGLSSAGSNPCSCLACHSGQSNGLAQRPSGSDFTCSATTRTDSFLTFTPSVLSKATSVSMDQREEVPLTR